MTRRSFESINYMIRPNKNVERKLILSTLNRLGREFPVVNYRYVGFGSMWFSDFVLMHKALGICDMVTIENQKSRARRVEFNKPFGCISVRMEDAATALGEVLDEKPSIVWLDYDGPLKNAVSGDVETAIGAMSVGSMLLVTVNAMVDQLRGHKDHDNEDLSETDYLVTICEDESLRSRANELTRVQFPGLAASILHGKIKSAVLEKKPGCDYQPIWCYKYADDADMITVGGMIVNEEAAQKYTRSNASELHHVSGEVLYNIELPILTEKEKRALDKRLPSDTPLKLKDIEFELRPSELEAYQRFYLEYPVFGEMSA